MPPAIGEWQCLVWTSRGWLVWVPSFASLSDFLHLFSAHEFSTVAQEPALHKWSCRSAVGAIKVMALTSRHQGTFLFIPPLQEILRAAQTADSFSSEALIQKAQGQEPGEACCPVLSVLTEAGRGDSSR